MKEQQTNSLVVTFTHSNYLEQASGTEKFVRTLSKHLLRLGYSHLVFFSIRTEFIYKMVGVIFDDVFVGVFKYNAIQKIIDSYCFKHNLSVAEVMLQHLRNHDTDVVKMCIDRLKVPVIFFVHDLYSICPSETMVDSEGRYCGRHQPSKECQYCSYAEKAIDHYHKLNTFLSNIGEYLTVVICPSLFLKDKWCSAFPNFLNISVVRPHNILSGFANYNTRSYPIRIAFCGAQIRNKGFDEFERLCKVFGNDERFRFFYLGKGNREFDSVTNVYVNNVSQGENAMQEAIKKQAIDCAFVWPLCPETYSYVYDELSLNGVYILTNKISGNIAAQVSENGNGSIFEKFEDVCQFLEGDEVIARVNEYREHGRFHPDRCKENNTLDSIIVNRPNWMYRTRKQIRIHIDTVMTLAYKAKNSLRKRR